MKALAAWAVLAVRSSSLHLVLLITPLLPPVLLLLLLLLSLRRAVRSSFSNSIFLSSALR